VFQSLRVPSYRCDRSKAPDIAWDHLDVRAARSFWSPGGMPLLGIDRYGAVGDSNQYVSNQTDDHLAGDEGWQLVSY
jgi:hypothetical protein